MGGSVMGGSTVYVC